MRSSFLHVHKYGFQTRSITVPVHFGTAFMAMNCACISVREAGKRSTTGLLPSPVASIVHGGGGLWGGFFFFFFFFPPSFPFGRSRSAHLLLQLEQHGFKMGYDRCLSLTRRGMAGGGEPIGAGLDTNRHDE